MKSISCAFFLFLFFITNSFKAADEIEWKSFDEGYKLAKKGKKIMLIDVYTDWCGWCKRMDKDAYEKSEIAALVKKDFVAIKFNPEKSSTYTFNGKQYSSTQLAEVISDKSINGYPTTIFLNPKSNKKKIVAGYKNAEMMKGLLQEALTELAAKKK